MTAGIFLVSVFVLWVSRKPRSGIRLVLKVLSVCDCADTIMGLSDDAFWCRLCASSLCVL